MMFNLFLSVNSLWKNSTSSITQKSSGLAGASQVRVASVWMRLMYSWHFSISCRQNCELSLSMTLLSIISLRMLVHILTGSPRQGSSPFLQFTLFIKQKLQIPVFYCQHQPQIAYAFPFPQSCLPYYKLVQGLTINIINWMQNKSSFVKSNYITPSTGYYRSIRYNITQRSSFHPNTTYIEHSKNVSNYTSKQGPSWRKPSSYSNHKQRNKRHSQNIENAEEFEAVDLKVSYLQTWQKLLSQPERNKAEDKKELKNITERVHLPSLIEYEPSNFTSLDPLFLPFEHIQQGINDLNRDLPAPKVEMAQIHHDMVNFKAKILAELEETEKEGQREFEKLRKMLRMDRVQCQEVNIRLKRQCEELKEIDRAYKVNFQTTKPRLDAIQMDLFSCKPFDLRRNPDLDDQFPQDYF